jgi:hypothetical protein
MCALDPMLRGPGASARVILVLNQSRMGAICFGMRKLLNQFRISNLGPQISIRSAVNSFCAPKQFLLILLDSCPDQSNECDHQFEPEREARERKITVMYELAISMGCALVWLDPTPADEKPKPRPTSVQTCVKPAERGPSAGQSKEGKKPR